MLALDIPPGQRGKKPTFEEILCALNLEFLRKMAVWERIYCWVLIALGIAGGVLATYMALNNIFAAAMTTPCYLQDMNDMNATEVSSSHG